MTEKKNFPEPVETLVVILIAFIFSQSIGIITLFISDESIKLTLTRIFLIIGSGIFFLIPFYYLRYKKYNLTVLFRLKPVSQEIILYSIIMGVVIGIIGDELDRLVSLIFPMPQFLVDLIIESLTAQSAFDWILLILGAVFLAAIIEEILFRGVLQVTLENKGDITRAVLLASISWTLVHVNPFWAIQIFIMGVIIGFLAWRTNSVIPGIIIHGLNNFISLLFINLHLEDELDWYLWGDHVNPIIFITALALLVWSIHQISNIYAGDSRD